MALALLEQEADLCVLNAQANKELPNVNKTLVIIENGRRGMDMDTLEELYLNSDAGTAARGGNLEYESKGGHTPWPARIEGY